MASAFGTTSNSDFFSALKEMTPFQSESKALGGSKKVVKDVVKQEISTPLGDLSNFFAGIDKSLINLVDFAKKSFGLDMLEAKDKSRKKLKAGDTDKPKLEKEGGMLETLTKALSGMGDAVGKMSMGEKMGAALLVGGLIIFNSLQEELAVIITPIVSILKGLVSFLGVGGTFNLFLIAFVGFKLGIIQNLTRLVAKKMGFTTLSNAFIGLQTYLGSTLPKKLAKTYNKGAFLKGFTLLGGAFKLLRLMLTATMYPAIIAMVSTLQAAMGPILGPIIVIAAIAAGIGAVLVSIQSGFEAFKTSLDQGDSMIVAIGKGILDFVATLATLPITLVKNIVGYIAGLLGFDGIKESLDNFSFKDMIVDAFTGLMSGTIKLLKAIGKGAMAALAAAFPGGESPTGAFGRVYKEVMAGGEGTMPAENPDKEKKTGFNRMDTSEIDVDIDGSEAIAKTERQKALLASTEDNKNAQVPTLATAKSLMTGDSVYNVSNTFNNETNIMKEKIKELLKFQLEKLQIEKDGKSNAPIMVNTTTQGDVYNQKSETNVQGELSTEHSDPTSKMISNAVMV